jgi:alkane 1-monooxygenase
MEHYGLTRKEVSPGKYEPIRPWHSWDSRALVSGKFLIHLQRHSDHHMNVFKEYQTLDFLSEAPQLPTGYPGLILIALIPPLWFRILDGRVTGQM